MRTFRKHLSVACLVLFIATTSASAQEAARIYEIVPATQDIHVGQKVKFDAVVRDAAGNKMVAPATAWFAAPFDLAGMDASGTVSFLNPGEVVVGAIVNGKAVLTRVMVKAGPVTRVEIEPIKTSLVVGSHTRLPVVARGADGNPRSDASLKWTSSMPGVATVDAAGVVTAIAPGKTIINASAGTGSANVDVTVVNSNLVGLSIEPRSTSVRTGDVVRFNVRARSGTADNGAVRWTVSGPAGIVDADGGFVAELPGSYVITAASGNQEAIASVVVAPRNAERTLEVVGRAPVKGFEAAEEWIIGDYAYLSTISDKLLVFNISNPAEPKLTDTDQGGRATGQRRQHHRRRTHSRHHSRKRVESQKRHRLFRHLRSGASQTNF